MIPLSLLGSSGSIGVQTLDVVRAEPGVWDVVALGAGRSIDQVIAQAREFRPRLVVVGAADRVPEVRDALPGVEVASGPAALAEAAAMGDVVVNGVVGFAGLPVTLAALEAGRRLALANKESLIAAGPVVQRARRTPGAELLPVDSEHCAVHQCLRANDVFTPEAGMASETGMKRVHRQRGAVSRPNSQRAGRCDGGACAGPSHLEHGTQDHGGLLHAYEQGLGGDRSQRAFRLGL